MSTKSNAPLIEKSRPYDPKWPLKKILALRPLRKDMKGYEEEVKKVQKINELNKLPTPDRLISWEENKAEKLKELKERRDRYHKTMDKKEQEIVSRIEKLNAELKEIKGYQSGNAKKKLERMEIVEKGLEKDIATAVDEHKRIKKERNDMDQMYTYKKAQYTTDVVHGLSGILSSQDIQINGKWPQPDYRKYKLGRLLQNCQANILEHHKKQNALFAFIKFVKGKEKEVKRLAVNFKEFKLTSAYDQLLAKEGNKSIDRVRCLYLTYAGYKYLGIKDHLIPDDGSGAFREGLMNRTSFGRYADANKLDSKFSGEIHALLLIGFDEDAEQPTKLKQIRANVLKVFQEGICEVFFETSTLKPQYQNGKPIYEGKESHEWFGFRDGISNPRFFTSKKYDSEPSPLNLALRSDPLGGQPYACGSFLAFVKMQQNVKAFQKATQKIADKLDISEERAGALLIGRHKDGLPITENKSKARDERSLEPQKLNSFNYQDDADGLKCPLHAHIRKANPRRPGDERRRIVRRGMIYGNNNTDEKGLLFMSFQSKLQYQFEDMVNRYLFRYDSTDKDDGSDPLLANDYGYRKYALKYGDKTKRGIRLNQEIVTFKGGMYFFAPSISFFEEVLPNML